MLISDMEEYLMQGKDSYWPLYSLSVDDGRVIEVVKFRSLGPRQKYKRSDLPGFVERTIFEKMLDAPMEESLSDEDWLTKKIEEGKSTQVIEDQTSEVPLIRVKREGTKDGRYKTYEVRKLKRLRLEDSIIRDCLSDDLNLEQLCRLHGLKAASNVRICCGSW